jgi:hypothetical protein
VGVPTTGFATLTIDPTGADNSVIYTADTPGTGGNAITVAYATPAVQATTTVAVSTNAITVTPGTKARMVVTGTLTTDGTTPVVFDPLIYAGIAATKSGYSHDGSVVDILGDEIHWVTLLNKWQIRKNGTVLFQSSDAVATPDLVTTWVPQGSTTGTPSVTAGISSAAQVIAAVNASTPAAALVTAAAAGIVTGAVATVAAANLTGGGTPTQSGTFIGQLYRDTSTGIWYRWTGAAWDEDAGEVTLAGSQTLSAKTLTDPVISGVRESVTNLGSSGASKTLVITASTVQQMTMTAACAVTMPTIEAGRSFLLHVIAGSNPAWIPTFNSTPAVNWGGAVPAMNTTPGARNIYSFHVSPDGTGWNGALSGGGVVETAIIDGNLNAVSGNAVFDAMALKAPLASPSFTGGVTSSGYIEAVGSLYTTGNNGGIHTAGTDAAIYTYGDDAPIYTYGINAFIATGGANAHISTQAANIQTVSGQFIGAGTGLTGTAASLTAGAVSSIGNLTGVVTSVNRVTSIADGAITNAMLANGAVANLSGANTGDQTSVSGNAGTATALQTARTIAGVSFNGTANIAITAANVGAVATSGNEAISGAKTFTGAVTLTEAQQTTNASAVTRAMSDNAAFEMLGKLFFPRKSPTTSHAGTGAYSDLGEIGTVAALYASTATASANAWARAIIQDGLNTHPAYSGVGIYNIPAAVAVSLISLINNSDLVIRILVGTTASAPATLGNNAFTAAGYGMEITYSGANVAIRAIAHNGTTYYGAAPLVSIGRANISDIYRVFEVRSDAAGNITAVCRIGRTILATSIITTGPTTTLGGQYVEVNTSSNGVVPGSYRYTHIQDWAIKLY